MLKSTTDGLVQRSAQYNQGTLSVIGHIFTHSLIRRILFRCILLRLPGITFSLMSEDSLRQRMPIHNCERRAMISTCIWQNQSTVWAMRSRIQCRHGICAVVCIPIYCGTYLPLQGLVFWRSKHPLYLCPWRIPDLSLKQTHRPEQPWEDSDRRSLCDAQAFDRSMKSQQDYHQESNNRLSE